MASRHSSPVVWQSALVWAVGLFVVPFAGHKLIAWYNEATNYSLDPSFGGYFHALLIALPAGGALAAYLTIRLLRQYTGLPRVRALGPALAWAVALFLAGWLPLMIDNLIFLPAEPEPMPLEGFDPEPYTPPFARLFARSAISWLIAGLVGGAGIARGLRAGRMPAGWRRMGLITFGWGAAFALGGAIVNTGMNLFFWYGVNGRDLGWLVNEILLWAVYGLAGLIAAPAAVLFTLAIVRQTLQAAPSGPSGDQFDQRPLGPVQL